MHPNQMLYFSLDQNLLSEFSKVELGRKAHPAAGTLLHELRRAVALGLVACPVHANETVSEAVLLSKDIELRDAIWRMAGSLSCDRVFRDLPFAVFEDTIRLVRPSYQPRRAHQAVLSPPSDLAETERRMRRQKEQYAQRLVVSGATYPPQRFVNGMDAPQIQCLITVHRRKSMLSIAEQIRDTGTFEPRDDLWEVAMGVGWHLVDQKVGHAECAALVGAIGRGEWELAPVMSRHTRLCAQLEYRKLRSTGKADPNDSMDLSRLAVALVDADAILCDKMMTHLLDETPFAAVPHYCLKSSGKLIELLGAMIAEETGRSPSDSS
jgi:hypothetical protein